MADDLRETLRAAMRGDEGGETVIVDPVVVADEPAPVEQAAPTTAEDTNSGQERDETGRFKAKPKTEGEPTVGAADPQPVETAPEKSPESAKPEERGPQAEATPIPPSLSAAVKAQWNELPEPVRKDIARLEASVQTAKAEWGKKGERLNRYDEIVAPHLDRWALSGLDAISGLQTLIAAQAVLDRDPIGGLIQVARSYNVQPAQLAQALGLQQMNGAQPGAEGQYAPTAVPGFEAALQPLVQQVQTLQQHIQQSQQASEAAELSKAQAQVEAFATDPANLYFENVRPRVAALLESKQANTLVDAYQMAIWADPDIRPILLDQQSKEAARAAREAADKTAAEAAQRSKAQRAQHAGGSVTGSPAPGSQEPGRTSTGNLREDLLAATREVAARA